MSPTDLTALNLGQAWDQPRKNGATGEVIACFDAAVYLRLNGQVTALVDGAVHAGPLHARVATLPGVDVGQRVRIDSGVLRLGALTVDVRSPMWRPPIVRHPLAAAPMLEAMVDHAPELGLGAQPTSVSDIREHLQREGLTSTCTWLIGRGRGLTPAGDDVASGLLLTYSISGAQDIESLRQLASAAATHEISRAFLTWAAAGQGIAPVHDLIAACEQQDRAAAAAALAQLATVGHTSGMDVAAGIAAGIGALSAVAARDASSAQAQTDR